MAKYLVLETYSNFYYNYRPCENHIGETLIQIGNVETEEEVLNIVNNRITLYKNSYSEDSDINNCVYDFEELNKNEPKNIGRFEYRNDKFYELASWYVVKIGE